MIIEVMAGCVAIAVQPPVRCRCIDVNLASGAVVRPYVGTGHAAFVGRAISSRVVRDTFAYEANRTATGFERGAAILTDMNEFKVVVNASWGASVPDTIAVRTPVAPSMCGADIVLNRSYLFLSGRADRAAAHVDRCVPPIPETGAGNVMHLLDEATPRVKRGGQP